MAGSSNPLGGLILTAGQQQQLTKLAAMPRHPPEIIARFPSLQNYDDEMQNWFKSLVFNLQQGGISGS